MKNVYCAIYNCNNSSERCAKLRIGKKSFFRIPKIIRHHDEETELRSTDRREKWFQAIKRRDMDTSADHYRVCSDHFVSGKPAKLYESLDPDWVPTMNLGYPKKSYNSSRYKRTSNRVINKSLETAVDSISEKEPTTVHSDNSSSSIDNTNANDDNDNLIDFNVHDDSVICNVIDLMSGLTISTQTDLTMQTIDAMSQQLVSNTDEMSTLKKEISLHKIGKLEWFTNDEKVKFYTGIPNSKVLVAIFNFVKDHIKCSRSILSKFEKFSLTLMRMRLNLTLTDLAYRYCVSKSTTSTVFLDVLDVFFYRLRPLIKWPGREQLKKKHLWYFVNILALKLSS